MADAASVEPGVESRLRDAVDAWALADLPPVVRCAVAPVVAGIPADARAAGDVLQFAGSDVARSKRGQLLNVLCGQCTVTIKLHK